MIIYTVFWNLITRALGPFQGLIITHQKMLLFTKYWIVLEELFILTKSVNGYGNQIMQIPIVNTFTP